MRIQEEWTGCLNECIEPVPVRDTFVVGVSAIEDLGNGMIRSWLYTEEGGAKIVRVKLVIPLVCAAVMNMHGAKTLLKILAAYPNLARILH